MDKKIGEQNINFAFKKSIYTNFNIKKTTLPENGEEISELCDKLKRISYDELVFHGFLTHSPDGKFVCPIESCQNGTGENGTGIEEHIEANGVVTSHCYKCGSNFDNIRILATYYHLDERYDFKEIILRGARDILNIDTEFESQIDNSTETTLILKDITDSQKNLSAFLESRRGFWRGLSFDTLSFFHIGFLERWTHPKNIVNSKNVFYSRRIIIPTGSQNYNAIMLNEDRDKFPKKSWKLNAGNKKIFGLDYLPLNIDLVILTEG